VLAADQLILKPRLFSSFLLWLLSELFENLPEVGDLEKPKLVFFFDEAHLLFDDAPEALRDRVEQCGAHHPVEGRRRIFLLAVPR
jgi:DNA helicase HerA-like ATPase